MYIIIHLLLTPIKACLSLILFLSDCVCTYVCIYHVYIDCNYNNFHKNKSAKWHCGRHTLICKKILI